MPTSLVHRAAQSRVVGAHELLHEHSELGLVAVRDRGGERAHIRLEVGEVLRGGRDDVAARDDPIIVDAYEWYSVPRGASPRRGTAS